MKAERDAKKMRAALMAGALAGAIALTGTLAWRNMSQETANEFVLEKNPGGRMHDDFNGVENKDIYAENFTDVEKGVPVFVRVKLLEYMELGDDAGLDRTVTDPATGEKKPNPDRKVQVVGTYLKDGVETPADINDTSTWYVHKPDTEEEKDPFHQYWVWDQSGSTVYMPTFNKNKDSVTVDVNGTYVGTDGIFESGKPYDDYTPRKMGDSVTADAYYDADSNAVDEYYAPDGTTNGVPGGGGTEKDADHPDGNFTKKEETHGAALTLNSLGVITMDQWVEEGMPICNKWVWDEDGWFYWPEPIMPQSATGLLLDKVTRSKRVTKDSYYAIDVVSQFVDADKTTWGAPAEGENPATGIYQDGISDNALALLDQAASVQMVTETNGNRRWYRSLEENIYKEILDDEGGLSGLICAGEDELIGTDDDSTDVVFEEKGVTVNGKDYGHYFLKPTDDQPFYRAVGLDALLGTDDDDRLWLIAGGAFPSGLIDKVVDKVELTAAGDAAETELGASLKFTAVVKLGDSLADDQGVLWSVTSASGADLKPGTAITPEGLLTVAPDETETQLVVTAASRINDQILESCTLKVYGKRNVKVTPVGSASVKAGKSITLKARLFRGEELAAVQPDDFTWSAGLASKSLGANTIRLEKDPKAPGTAVLTIGRGVSGTVTVTAFCEGVDPENTKSLDLDVTDPEAVSVELHQPRDRNIEAGGTLTFTANVDAAHVDELETPDISWEAGTLDADDGKTIHSVTGITISGGVLTVADDYQISRGTEIYVKATAAAPTAGGAYQLSDPITIAGPDSIEIGVKDGAKAQVAPGEKLALTATLRMTNGKVYEGADANSKVTWTVANGVSGTSVNANGELTAADAEVYKKTLTVTATAKMDGSVVATKDVIVNDDRTLLSYGENIPIDGRSVTIDGVDFIVLAMTEDNSKTLILAKDVVAKREFGAYLLWSSSGGVRDYLNGEWLKDKGILSSNALETTLYTRNRYDIGWNNYLVKTVDKVFLLSEPDVNGTVYDGTSVNFKEYTAGGKFVWPSGNWIANDATGTATPWWLRNPRQNNGCNSCIFADGTVGANSRIHEYGLRPALWINTSAITDQLNKTS